jgi:ribose transport system permease protein
MKQRIMNIRKRSLSDRINENRALILVIAVFILGAIFVPGFTNSNNLKSILHGASLTAIVSIGFTIVMCTGHFDLSSGAALMLCGSIAIGLRENGEMSWILSIFLAVLAGGFIGLINGFLVTKGRISSFIVTLGMMKVVLGLNHIITRGVNLYLTTFILSDILGKELFPLITTTSIICIILVVFFSFFMTRTKYGRNMFIIGGNPQTAIAAGIRKDYYTTLAFVISGSLAAIGGVTFAIGMGTTTIQESLATTTFTRVLSATIIGGTLLSGGKGSVLKTYIAVLMLTTVFNVMGCYGVNFQIQLMVNGLIFATVVVYDSYAELKSSRQKGQRPNLVGEVIELKKRLSHNIRSGENQVL